MADSPYPGPRDTQRLPPLSGDSGPGSARRGDLPTAELPPLRAGGGDKSTAFSRGTPRHVAQLAVPAAVGALVTLGVLAATGNVGRGSERVVTQTATVTAPAPLPNSDRDAQTSVIPATSADSIQGIIKANAPGLVKIEVSAGFRSGTGSGFLIDGAGHIVTNQHVVEDATTVTVQFLDKSSRQAKVLGTDPTMDLAVLKVTDLPVSAKPFVLGRSAGLTVGDPVLAMGNPLGLEQTVTTGIVSALKRAIKAPDPDPNVFIQNAIQTDAAINPGNSGGPLLDGKGRVVGINSQIASQSGGNEGIGFAIPIDSAKPIVDSIISAGKSEHAWIGIGGFEFTPDAAKRVGVSRPGGGLGVECVVSGGPAAKAGLKGDKSKGSGADVFDNVDGRPIGDYADLNAAIASRKVGETVKIRVIRSGQAVDLDVTLGNRPTNTDC